MLNNRISVATITYATPSPCLVPLKGMFLQESATQWNKLRMWKISNFFVSNALGKHHLSSAWTKYAYDKRENARVCAKWQWNALDWCYWIALPASPVVQSSNTVSCVSLSFRTHPCVRVIVKQSCKIRVNISHISALIIRTDSTTTYKQRSDLNGGLLICLFFILYQEHNVICILNQCM